MSTTPQPKASGIPWFGIFAVAVLFFLAFAGAGLLVYAWITTSTPVAVLPTAVATQAASTPVAARPSATAMVVPTVTPEAATATPESATGTPVATDTAEAPTDSPTPSEPMLTLSQSANVRSGPGINYPVIGGLQGGTSMPVVGRDAAAQWFVISYGSRQGWVSGQVSSYSADASALPVIKAPPPPPPTPVPPTSVPPTAVPPTNPPPPSAHGIQGALTLCDPSRTTYAAGEWICVIETIYNASKNAVNYGILGVNAINMTGGPNWFQSSWMGLNHAGNYLVISPNCTGPVGLCDGPWKDGFKLQAGTYQFTLSICYSNAKTCQGGGVWETLTAPFTVVVQ
jgi:Bacterial SH3 domain